MWRKSSFSHANGNCVDVAWRKSSFSFSNGNCVEIKVPDGSTVLVRDSKDQSGPVLQFTAAEWNAFVQGAKAGEFDSFGQL